ncbi:MAG: cellulase family glycosylhydrolase [Flavobacteriales bacterium]|nr:MAG: cellulase family glycosylhydrolase [Flavobacteriales bacterium]
MSRPSGFLLAALVFVVLFGGCGGTEPSHSFVGLDKNGFVAGGERFFPKAVNYIACLRTDGKEVWMAPSTSYASHVPGRMDLAADSLQLRADLQLIRDMGFNTVRVVGFAEQAFDSAAIMLRARDRSDSLVWLSIEDEQGREKYLGALTTLIGAVRAAGLRCILLTQVRPYTPATEHHFALVADHFVNDTVILAYDLFNEPLYFDRPERPKEEAWAILQRWRALFDEHAPNHLYTLGLTGIRETFEFDPNMLTVDFISYHPYEYEPDQVRNELRWYANNVDVPWIIGETAIPADNDSVPYADQEEFARKTLLQSRACGAIGYSWWQFQDVKWGRFHADYMGVLNREGVSVTSVGDTVFGTRKPVAGALKGFDPWTGAGECLCLPNYLNYSDGRVSKVSGRLVDEHGVPINEGTVIAWNEVWNESYHTTSGSDGRFELRAPIWLHHWMASASRYSMDRGDCDPNAMVRSADGVPGYELGDIRLDRLDFVP